MLVLHTHTARAPMLSALAGLMEFTSNKMAGLFATPTQVGSPACGLRAGSAALSAFRVRHLDHKPYMSQEGYHVSLCMHEPCWLPRVSLHACTDAPMAHTTRQYGSSPLPPAPRPTPTPAPAPHPSFRSPGAPLSPTPHPCPCPPTPPAAALVRLFRGHIAELLRHPQGADVLVDLYDVAPSALRNSMCAEFYGKEYALFDGVSQPGSSVVRLSGLMACVPVVKQRRIMQYMSRCMLPIVEKAILHPPMAHR